MCQARPDIDAIEHDLADALETVREAMGVCDDDSPEEHAMVSLECFCKVALEVFRKVPANRIRAVARHFEIQARLNGADVLTTESKHETRIG